MSGCANLRTFALKAGLFPIFRAIKLISWEASPSQVIPLYLIAFFKQFGRSAGSFPDQRLMSESKKRGTVTEVSCLKMQTKPLFNPFDSMVLSGRGKPGDSWNSMCFSLWCPDGVQLPKECIFLPIPSRHLN